MDIASELRHWRKACDVIAVMSGEYHDAYSDHHNGEWIDPGSEAHSDYIREIQACFSVV